jgi:tryptophan synthase beta chain
MSLPEPSSSGRFGEFGGRYVPETLVPACQELEAAFREAWADQSFRDELDGLLADYAGRPSPITECHRLSAELGVRVLLKREDLNHTGSHKINNVLGQALLAKRMGKTRLVAETGAGQHGVASATAAAKSSWAKSTWNVRHSTCSACVCSVLKLFRQCLAAERSKTQ